MSTTASCLHYQFTLRIEYCTNRGPDSRLLRTDVQHFLPVLFGRYGVLHVKFTSVHAAHDRAPHYIAGRRPACNSPLHYWEALAANVVCTSHSKCQSGTSMEKVYPLRVVETCRATF